MKNRAFTLIELLVVVLIIGILSAIALPQYQKAVMRSRAVKGIVYLSAIAQAQKEYKLANGKYTGDIDELSINFADSVTCSANNDYAICGVHLTNTVYFQWVGYHEGEWRWECVANKNDARANQLCAAYQAQWGGTLSYEQENGNKYYIGNIQK